MSGRSLENHQIAFAILKGAECKPGFQGSNSKIGKERARVSEIAKVANTGFRAACDGWRDCRAKISRFQDFRFLLLTSMQHSYARLQSQDQLCVSISPAVGQRCQKYGSPGAGYIKM